MKREIKILIETDSALVEEGFVRVAVTEQDDSYRLHSLSRVYQIDTWETSGFLNANISSQVRDYLNSESVKVAWSG